ncbi:glycine/betaine ABC transporter substrate-binding protein [Amycolatopsis antarctica]|uniref:Glycine/betaine ABC transporter substrate-binding protein n=1 Tax=Amycolatopsis antarctica TaxID=1854586 RepID=A0A263D2V7_9PSEU|nr:glycine betaine ABC transporter substrate-binding protein [Amycolatopsis antarctica]OZM72539.1 glycine/betaine ABC transporter substrate-binding protein [Amycolatopsis antarctica]
MSTRTKRVKAALAVTLAGFSLTACGLETNASIPFQIEPGSIAAVPALEGVEITVGSKDFTENILLGYMAEIALSAAGAEVTDLTDIKGSNSSRQALEAGQTDVTWEYTGTGWISYQGNEKPIPDEQQQYDAVNKADQEQNGITWLDYSPVNNTYAFATTAEYAEKNGLNTTSDMTEFLKQNPAEAVFCLETEFVSRQDGFPGVQQTYGFPSGEIKQFGTGAIYAAVASGTCQFGEIFTTDGRIAGLNLKVLEDDKKFFPQYNAAATLRTEFLEQHPEIRGVLEPLGQAMDNTQMIELCKQVDVDGRDPGDVALDWMVSKGFVKSPDSTVQAS